MFFATKPSARSALRAMSSWRFDFAGAWLPDFLRPASSTTELGEAPEPSIWRLQRMHLPSFGRPCGSGRPVGPDGGSGLPVSARPMTATRFCAFGQWTWNAYDTAPAPFSEVSRYLSHRFGKLGTLRERGSV